MMDWRERNDLVRDIYMDYLDAVDINESSAQHPHCDDMVLHAPGECVHCDHYPKRQALRETYRINFTGDLSTPLWWACPAEVARPLETINLWGGNVPRD